MRTEEEVIELRTDFYRMSVLMKQQGISAAVIMPMFVELLDWVLGEHNFDNGHLVRLLDNLDADAKKLALF